jgi:hypothetical protein
MLKSSPVLKLYCVTTHLAFFIILLASVTFLNNETVFAIMQAYNFTSAHKTYITRYNQTGVAINNITTQIASGNKLNATNFVPQNTTNFLLNSVTNGLLQSFNQLSVEGTMISPDKKTSISIDPIDQNLEEHSHTKVTISGMLKNITTNSPLDHKEISIKLSTNNSDSKPQVLQSWPHQYTDADGIFTASIEDFNYPKGKYIITARPTDNNIYSGEDVARGFVVLEHTLSFADLSSYITIGGVIVGIFAGILSGIPPLVRWRNRLNLCRYMKEIDGNYNSLEYLKSMKTKIIDVLRKGKISEEQYDMLNTKISDYMNKVTNS